MQITVALNKDLAKLAAAGMDTPDLKAVLSSVVETKVVRVFGRGRSAKVETSPAGFAQMKREFGHLFVFSRKLPAKAFGTTSVAWVG